MTQELVNQIHSKLCEIDPENHFSWFDAKVAMKNLDMDSEVTEVFFQLCDHDAANAGRVLILSQTEQGGFNKNQLHLNIANETLFEKDTIHARFEAYTQELSAQPSPYEEWKDFMLPIQVARPA